MSVVICAYSLDRWEDLMGAVASVLSQSQPPKELVVVVDHNESLLRKLQAELPSRARAVPSVGRQGLSGARNTGVGVSSGHVVAFLDDDARARPGWLLALVETYAEDVIGVGGLVLANWDSGRPGWFPAEFDWVVGCSYRGLPERTADIRNVMGANMSFSREALNEAGAFDPRLGRSGTRATGNEETDLCIRARAALPGRRILLNPAAVVDHRVPRRRARLRYFVERCFGEGLSKYVLAGLLGPAVALSTERTYARRVLPAGILRGLRDLVGGDIDGGRRALAILVGLAATMAGFTWGSMTRAHSVGLSSRDPA